MTSELKSDLPSFGYADGGYMSKCSRCKETFLGAKRAWSCELCAIKKSLEPKIEQPKPDVPELVRYHIDSDGMQECNDGGFVLYDQYAAVIAALKSKLYDMRVDRDRSLEWRDHDKKRAEAAEAKLAQYEAQEPVGYVTDRVKTRDGGHCFMSLHQAAPYINPVYASPLASEGGKD